MILTKEQYTALSSLLEWYKQIADIQLANHPNAVSGMELLAKFCEQYEELNTNPISDGMRDLQAKRGDLEWFYSEELNVFTTGAEDGYRKLGMMPTEFIHKLAKYKKAEVRDFSKTNPAEQITKY